MHVELSRGLYLWLYLYQKNTTQLFVDAAGHQRWYLVCYRNQMALLHLDILHQSNATCAAHTFV